MEDDNNIIIKDGIVEAISFNGDVSGATYVLVGTANIFGNIALKKTKFKIITGAKETHELCLWKYLV